MSIVLGSGTVKKGFKDLFSEASPEFKFIFTIGKDDELLLEELNDEQFDLLVALLKNEVTLDGQKTSDLEWINTFAEKYDVESIKSSGLIILEREDYQDEERLRKDFLNGLHPDKKLAKYAINPFDFLDDFRYLLTVKNLPGVLKDIPFKKEGDALPEGKVYLKNKGLAIVPNIRTFQKRLLSSQIRDDSIFIDFDWANVCLAGGAVLKHLLVDPQGFDNSDYDLFLYGMTSQQATEKIRDILLYFAERGFHRFIRSQYVISILGDSFFDGRPIIQIILRLYTTPEEVLLGFDLDSVKVAYDGKRIIMFPSCQRSILHQYNLANGDQQIFRTGTFERRLVKYQKRGFRIRVPSFSWNCFPSKVFMDEYDTLPGLGKLVRLVADQDLVERLTTPEVGDYNQGLNLGSVDSEKIRFQYEGNPNFIFVDAEETDLLLDADLWFESYQTREFDLSNFHIEERYQPQRPNIPRFIQFSGSLGEYLSTLSKDDEWYGNLLTC